MTSIHFREPASAWTHLVALGVWIPGLVMLWRRGGGDLGRQLSLAVYGLSLVFCYGASSLYHAVQVPGDRLGPYLRLDGIGIFALIAGSYTPLAWNLMRGGWRAGTLATVWGVAGSSMALIASGRSFSPGVGTGLYLGLGWGVIVCYARLARVVSHRALLPLVLGGVSYSVGAVLNLMHRPTLWPGTFGTHDLFHLFVIAGSLAHFRFVARVVVPFRWPAGCPTAFAPGAAAVPI